MNLDFDKMVEKSNLKQVAYAFAIMLHEQIFTFVSDSMPKEAFNMHKKLPMRVKVWSGDKSEYLGEGNYVADVTVYFSRNPDGSLSSFSNAEEKPENVDFQESKANPKIILDSGETIYGAQCWFEPLDLLIPREKPKKMQGWSENSSVKEWKFNTAKEKK